MGIDNVAIKTFNSTGSQSVCRTNAADDTKAIESQVLTKCKTEYINGSGMSFIAGTLTGIPVNGSNIETYHLPSDVDAISEILLQFRFKCDFSGGNTALSASFLLDIINKIEMKIGNITYQTILPGDIYARNLTENGSLLKVEHVGVSTSAANSGLHVNGSYFDFALSIPFTGRNSNLKGCFLQAGAITNSLIMKVTYNIVPSTVVNNGAAIYNLIELGSVSDVSTGICIFSHQITQTEKNFIQNNIINRVVKASQGIRTLHNFSGTANEDIKLTVDLSSININVSHILLTLERGVYGISTTTAVTGGIAKDDGSGGTVAKGTCWRPLAESSTVDTVTLGVLKGWLKNAELILGNDRTGAIPASCITTNRIEQFGLVSTDNKNIYVIKLAETAFSTAGIPFSKLNNKKLVLTFNALQVQDIATGSTDQSLLSVTCCGTQVQTTVTGGHSFSG